ncbi:transketolase [Demequina capsici]|uniref:Transketolase n=1 Tax=Demequina capsici TaxID=3075620 RepID=A0AA96J9E4_9MICO|nr:MULTISPECIES: transketolase [unclassified Demequina]WNM25918.1 transketolase [Demequina sp. OYTSA14]WNM28819.1 transketolase [Demequina sp. PMTSA13]
MSLNWTAADHRAVDTLRVLAADAVEKVGNGHPGTAISLAPAAYLLFQNVMRHDPADSKWLGRDRFVLSAGHSSLTLYLQLFASGYDLSLDDLKQLRTEGSKTPGHPEYGHTDGVEITTGPLGSGIASSVGMAMAARRERGLLDPAAAPGTSPFDHFVYVIAGDGDLQEGVSHEGSALAGTQELGNLIVIWDDNRISIEHETDISFTEDVLKRYEAYGWHTQHVNWITADGYKEDPAALLAAIEAAQAETGKPSIIRLSTIIGWPSPTKQNSGGVHGSALGATEVAGLKEVLGFDPEQSFVVEPDVLARMREVKERGQQAHSDWNAAFSRWEAEQPERAALLARIQKRELPEGWEAALPQFEVGSSVATRSASGKVLTALAPVLPELWGGSADLAGSNNTTMDGEPSFLPPRRSTHSWPNGDWYGRTLHFGIREFGMGTILNGITLHGLTRAYGGTFLVFSDYMRASVRLAALMRIPTTFVWTHDSVGLGEDGPTHQPIEHVATLRAIPGLDVIRPADANETAYAWKTILETTDRPSAIVLTRQNVPTLAGTSADGVDKGAYVLAGADEDADVVIIATGSEVSVAVEARDLLAADGIKARVVSMPSRERFERQDAAYRESVLPAALKARVSVEAGSSLGWREIVGDAGRIVSVDHFGESASGSLLLKKYGFTAENVAAKAQEAVEATR